MEAYVNRVQQEGIKQSKPSYYKVCVAFWHYVARSSYVQTSSTMSWYTELPILII